jgi:hypothetical protein
MLKGCGDLLSDMDRGREGLAYSARYSGVAVAPSRNPSSSRRKISDDILLCAFILLSGVQL